MKLKPHALLIKVNKPFCWRNCNLPTGNWEGLCKSCRWSRFRRIVVPFPYRASDVPQKATLPAVVAKLLDPLHQLGILDVRMKSLSRISAFFGLITACVAETNSTAPLSSHIILPAQFKPPQVFENVNLLRTINLEKGYIKETINVVIENVDTKPQDEYYIPFKAELVSKVGGLEVGDKKAPERPKFRTEVVEYDPYR